MTSEDHGDSAQCAPYPPQVGTWLPGAVQEWQRRGLVTSGGAEGILALYSSPVTAENVQPQQTPGANRVLHVLGTVMIGVAIAWLVGANIEDLTDGQRLGVFSSLWLVFTAVAEGVRWRWSQATEWVAMFRTLALVAVGASIMQWGHMQGTDPDEDPWLLGLWVAVALVYAVWRRSGVGAVFATVVGAAFLWLQFGVSARQDKHGFSSVAAWTTMLFAVASLYTSVVVWTRRSRPFIASTARVVGTVAALVALLAGSLMLSDVDGEWTVPVSTSVAVAAMGVAGVVAALTWWVRGRVSLDRHGWDVAESLVPLGIGAVLIGIRFVGLQLGWYPEGNAEGSAYAMVNVLGLGAGILACVWYAVLGSARNASGVLALAVGALVILVAWQTTLIFVEYMSGAWVALIVGLVLLALASALARGRKYLRRFAGAAT